MPEFPATSAWDCLGSDPRKSLRSSTQVRPQPAQHIGRWVRFDQISSYSHPGYQVPGVCLSLWRESSAVRGRERRPGSARRRFRGLSRRVASGLPSTIGSHAPTCDHSAPSWTPRVVRANGGHGIHGENGAIEKRERSAGIAVSAVRARRPCIRTPFPVTGTALFVVGPPKAPVLRRTPKVRQSQPCTRRRCLGVSAMRKGAGVPDAGARTGVCRACELGRRWVGW